MGHPFFLRLVNQGLQQTETVHLRFKVVLEQGRKTAHLRIHNHDIRRNAGLPQVHAFVSHGHGQIIHLMILQGFGNLHSAGPVSRRLYHTYHLRLRLHETAVIVQIIHYGIQIDLQCRFVHLQGQVFRQNVETERPCPFDENHFVVQRIQHTATQQFIRGTIKTCLHAEQTLYGRQARTDSYELLHTAHSHQTGHAAIQILRRTASLLDITQNQRTFPPRTIGTTVHEVEGDIQRIIIRIVTVVNERTTRTAFFHLQAHGHRFEHGHPCGNRLGTHPQMQAYGQAGHGIGQRSLVDKRNRTSSLLTFIYIGHNRLCLPLLHRCDI